MEDGEMLKHIISNKVVQFSVEEAKNLWFVLPEIVICTFRSGLKCMKM